MKWFIWRGVSYVCDEAFYVRLIACCKRGLAIHDLIEADALVLWAFANDLITENPRA